MNTAVHNMSPDSASSEKLFEDAFSELEGPIITLVSRARALDWMVGLALERPESESERRMLPAGMVDAIYYSGSDICKDVDALDKLWTELSEKLSARVR